MLGVVVEVTVRLLPIPRRVELLLAAFDDVGRCADAVGKLIASGIVPAGLEMMDAPAIRAAEAFAQCGYPLDAAALLLCEIDGLEARRRRRRSHGPAQRSSNGGATSVRIAADADERRRMWSGRKSALPGRRPARARLLLHGRYDPAPAPGGSACADRRAVAATTGSRWPTCFTPAMATCTR